MGLFDQILKRKPDVAQQTVPVPKTKKEPEPTEMQTKKRTSWIDELADPNSGVHEALAKLKVPDPPKTELAYRIENERDGYFVIYKNGKEFFDGDKIASYGEYILAEGWRGNGEAFALFTSEKFVAIRKCEDGVEGSVVLPSGIAFVFTDADKVVILSEDGTSSKAFGYGSAPDEARVLSGSACAFAEDMGDHIVLKCFLYSSQSVWTKKIKIEVTEGDPALRFAGGALEVSAPGVSAVRFNLNGDKL